MRRDRLLHGVALRRRTVNCGAALMLGICAGFVCRAESEPAAAHSTAFGVRESIGLTRILTISGDYYATPGEPFALFSPDKRYFIVRTRQGDLDRDQNVERLLLWATETVARGLQKEGSTIDAGQILLEHRFHDDNGRITNLKWLDGEHLGFIAADARGCMQAFSVSIRDRMPRQMTRSATDVVSFAVSADRVVYFAREEDDLNGTAVRVSGRSFYSLLRGASQRSGKVRLYQASRGSGVIQELPMPAASLPITKIWIAPDGTRAVTLAPIVGAPTKWRMYKVFDDQRNYGIASDDASQRAGLNLRLRYQLINLKTNSLAPLIDAPAGFLASASAPVEVFWKADSSTLIVSHTYLPLDGIDDNRNAQGPATVEIDLNTGSARPIVWEPWISLEDYRKGARLTRKVVSLEWNPKDLVLIVGRSVGADAIEYESYQRHSGKWAVVPTSKAAEEGIAALQIERREDMRSPPVLYVRDAMGTEKMLLNPTPKIREYTFGRAELFRWDDDSGQEWEAELLYPVGYREGSRYPLVVQTHGLDKHEFLIDGPYGTTSAFAAQPLANSGFVVLQTGGGRITSDGKEAALQARGYHAGICKLVSRGLVDPEKIGFIGWSRTGFHAIGILAEYPRMLAAATISDASQFGYMQTMLGIGDEGGMKEVTSITGGLPTVFGYDKWFAGNPLYAITKSSAAVRIDSIGEPVSMWETYALLKVSGHAVDHVFYPKGSHNLLKPSERLESQGGTVDWFRFWLLGQEDPDPSKASQFAYWRELRASRSGPGARACAD